ncbi:MAG: glycosyltransferase family 9 protein, partial [Phycisphaerae bacterium]|nr:glycosyltransferase family 9 protein [Phycisphaerae bacterium]
MSPGQRIVILLPNWVGDVVMATPALDALWRCFRDAHIACLGRRTALEVLQPAEWVDEWIVDESDRANRVLGFVSLAGKVRSSQYDLAVLFPNSFRAALLARVGGVRRIAGYDRDWRGWMLTDKLAPVRDEKGRFTPVPAIDYYLGLAGLLGAGGESRRMSLSVSESSQAEAESILQQAAFGPGKPLVMLNPGASFGVSKMWDPDRYAAVADALIEKRGAQIIINAAPVERPVAAQVA